MKHWKEFETKVELILKCWSAYQYAVDNQLGGAYTRDKAAWFPEQLILFFRENPDLDEEEVEDWLSTVLFNEFDTILEDGSDRLTASLLCQTFRLLRDDRLAELATWLPQQLPSADKLAQIKQQSQVHQGNDDSDDDGEDAEAPQLAAAGGPSGQLSASTNSQSLVSSSPGQQQSQSQDMETDDINTNNNNNKAAAKNVVDEDGWTTIVSSRKGRTK